MSDRLLLRLAPDGGLTWLRQSGARATASVAGAPPADVLARADEIVVLVPAEEVLLTEVTLSARNRAQLMQALPFAVEEQLLAPVEELHFAAARPVEGKLGVAVVARAVLRGWLERLDAAGVRADALVPESLAVRAAGPQACVMLEEARAVTRLAPWSAFACSLAELPGWLALAGPRHALEVFDFRAGAPLALPQHVQAYHARQHDPLAFLAGGLAQLPLNLLDGEFAPNHRGARGQRWWRIAAALAAAVVVLALAGLGADVWRLSRESARLEAQSRDALHEAFPDLDANQLARLSPGQLMRGRLEHEHGSVQANGLLRLLDQLGPVLGNGSTRTQLRGLEYRNGVLEIALHAADTGSLDSVREQVATLGLAAELTAANAAQDGVDGRVRIEGAAGRGGAP
ncbi:type II secretion system protein GspL [Dokdonella fugitiva]|uniref:Type II secretion system protein L n=1 Tax=Dokdonella fugitiva TaxID=328517 RepID=A0A4R2I4U6_9GAMM|nr:type II secretion system protein GspL [Dokdonella fugitiva]TCO38947.1 general secretion pathway protein L [Dokdonella fugitiva]